MSIRPRTVDYAKTKRRRCPKCGKLLTTRIIRCKGCAMAQVPISRSKKRTKPFRTKKKR